jgi:hypothetical protein
MSKPNESGKGEDFIANVKRADAAKDAVERARPTPQKPRRATKRGKAGGYVAQALSNELDNIRKASPGTRNDTVNTALFNLGTLGPEAIDITMIKDSVRLAARSIGLPEKEIDLLLRDDDGPLSKGMARPRDMSTKGQRSGATDYVRPPPPPPVADIVGDIEDGFWTARESLQQIYIAALSRMCAPWSVLACCTARALATVRPNIVLPDIIGGAGSLNWFGAITASSGGGKGAAAATAKMLVTIPVLQRNTGSGEGMIGAYVRPALDDEPKGLHESIMFMVDEIDSLTAQSSRSGATTMSVLRSAFSGETLGFSYVNKNTPTLESHTYRMTMIVSVQPQRAAGLLADYQGGTPQRFMWFPGTDRRLSVDLAGGFVSPLILPKPGEWLYPNMIEIPKVARDAILRERVANMRGDTAALDGHALFMREKFAFGLALLDGRTYVSEEDWELSGIAAKVSETTRDWIGNMAEEARIVEAMDRGKLQGVSSMAADEERMVRGDENRGRVANLILKHVRAAGRQGITKREMQQKLAKDAKAFPPIAADLQEDGMLRFDGNRWYITGLTS